MTLALCLPRDAASVPVVRKIAAEALRMAGLHREDIADVELAVTEAASNVLRHSAEGDEYEVRLNVGGATLTLEVVDAGHGFNGEGLGRVDAAGTAEVGRGIQLMRALVDDVRFSYTPGLGSVVVLSKELRWAPDSPMHRFADHPAAAVGAASG